MIGKAGMTHRYCPDEGIVQTKKRKSMAALVCADYPAEL
jgi:hypothetical protein